MSGISLFLKGSAAISIGTIVGGALSYVFSVSMGRMLGPSLFGDLGTITALLMIISSVGGAVLTVTMHYSGKLIASGDYSVLAKLHRKFSIFLLSLALLLIVAGWLLSPIIVELFAISNGNALRLSLISVVLSLLVVVNRGILQGAQRFLLLSGSNIVELAVKVVLAFLFVKVGFELFGAIAAIVLSMLAAYIFTHFSIRDLITREKNDVGGEEGDVTKSDIIRYSIPTFLSTIFLLIVMNLDIILVKRYFEPIVAGQYIAVSTVAKIIFYITGPISSVMFPLITEQQAKGEKHYQTLVISLFVTILSSAVLVGIYYYWREAIVVALYGSDYRALGYLLPQAAWLVVFLSLVNLMTNYFMSIKRFLFVAFYAVVLFFQLVYTYQSHETIIEIVRSLQVSIGTLFLMMVIYYLATKRPQIIALWKNLR